MRAQIKPSRRFVMAGCLVAVPLVSAWRSPPAGYYVGTLQLEMLNDGRRARLLAPFAYVDPNGLRWTVPAGVIVDGASIPRILWGPIGGPWEGLYRNASVIHDYFCDVRSRSWQATHRVFHDAMKTSEVSPIQANYMYFAVRKFGPRWSNTVVTNTALALTNDDNILQQLSMTQSSDPTSLASLQDALRDPLINMRQSLIASPPTSGNGNFLSQSLASTSRSPFGETMVEFRPQGQTVTVAAEQTRAIDASAIETFAARGDIDRLTAEEIEALADAP